MRWDGCGVTVRSPEEWSWVRKGAVSPRGSICSLRSCSEALGTRGRGRHCYISACLENTGKKTKRAKMSLESMETITPIKSFNSLHPSDFLFLWSCQSTKHPETLSNEKNSTFNSLVSLQRSPAAIFPSIIPSIHPSLPETALTAGNKTVWMQRLFWKDPKYLSIDLIK